MVGKIMVPNRIVFDLDNTLYCYKSAHRPATDAVLLALAKVTGYPQELVEDLWHSSRKSVKARLSSTGSSHSRLLYILEVFRSSKIELDLIFSINLEEIYWKKFFENMVLFPNLLEFLQKVWCLNIETVLVTDLTAEIQVRKLHYLGLSKYFDIVISSEEAGGDKKTGKPWEMLEKLTKEYKTGHDWYIGDGVYDFNSKYRGKKDLSFMKVDALSAVESPQRPWVEFTDYADLALFLED